MMKLKFIKKTIYTTVCCISLVATTFSHAQFIRDETISENKKENTALTKIRNLSSINALLVGYGFYCKIDDSKIKMLHDNFNNNVINRLNADNKKMMLDNYEEKIKIAREKGPSFSSMTCENIYDEYSKILAIMKQEGGNSIKINPINKEK